MPSDAVGLLLKLRRGYTYILSV